MKYVIRFKDDGSYLRSIFITPEPNSSGIISNLAISNKRFAMTFKKKYLALAIAKAIGGEVEEAE